MGVAAAGESRVAAEGDGKKWLLLKAAEEVVEEVVIESEVRVGTRRSCSGSSSSGTYYIATDNEEVKEGASSPPLLN